MRRFKILYVDIDDGHGGSTYSLQLIVSHLDKSRFEPLLMFAKKSINTLWTDENITYFPLSTLDNYDFCLPRYDIRWIYFFIRWLIFIPSDLIKSLLILCKLRPDLIHINVGQPLIFGLAAKLMKIPVVWHIREMVSQNILGKMQVFMYRKIAKKIIAVSHAVTTRLGNKTDQIMVLHTTIKTGDEVNHLDISNFRSSIKAKPDTYLITILATFSTVKGHLFLADVADELSDLTNLKFVLCGRPEHSVSGKSHKFLRVIYRKLFKKASEAILIKRRWKDLENTGRVSFPGQVPSNVAIASSDIVVCPTLKTEPFGRTVIEAYAQSKPVITSNLPAFTETVKNDLTGWTLPLEPKIWAAKIREIYYNRSLGVNAGKRGKEECKKYDPVVAANSIMEIYDNLLKGHRQ